MRLQEKHKSVNTITVPLKIPRERKGRLEMGVFHVGRNGERNLHGAPWRAALVG